MPPLVLLAVAALSLAPPLLAWAVLARPDRARRRVVTNLRRGLGDAVVASADPAPARPRPSRVALLARRLTPAASVHRLERLLIQAGRPPAWPMDRILTAKLVLPLVAAALSLLYISTTPGATPVLIGVAVTVVSYFLPEVRLQSRGQDRRQQVAYELPDTIDQMTIAVEAGLGFEAAMRRVGRTGRGVLAEELVRTLQEIQVGQTHRQAYEGLAARTGVPELRRFVRAIIQAEAYGIPVVDVLRTQAAEMRLKRRQRAEEKAMQIPVKVVFPLMLCILPVLFIVLLGPAVMDIIAAFR